MWGSVCVFLYLGGCTIILIINSVFCRCTHLWSLRQDSCCWVYSRVGKVHQLPSRLPEIFHSAPVFQGTWLQTQINQSNIVGLFCPEAKGTLNCHFFPIHGATWGWWELVEEKKTGLGIVIASALKASFWPPQSLARGSCHKRGVPLGVNAAAPVLCTLNMGKLPQGSFGGKKPSSGLRFFLQALQFFQQREL